MLAVGLIGGESDITNGNNVGEEGESGAVVASAESSLCELQSDVKPNVRASFRRLHEARCLDVRATVESWPRTRI